MNVKKMIATMVFGMGLSVSLSSSADSPYETCIFACIDKLNICLNAGVDSSICYRFYYLCRNDCGVPQ